MSNKLTIGSCGLACVLCSANLKDECKGCLEEKASHCPVKACCLTKNFSGCYDCSDFPCEKEMFKNQRCCAFVECTSELGVDNMVNCLKKNHKKGIHYHTEDGSKGHYDQLETKEEIKRLIIHGRLDGENQNI